MDRRDVVERPRPRPRPTRAERASTDDGPEPAREAGAPEPKDARLADEPVGYWTGAAHRAVMSYLRAAQARFGLTTAQYWVLRQLSPDDLSADGSGRTVDELAEAMRAYYTGERAELAAEVDDMVGRGLLSRDGGGRVSITPGGEERRLAFKKEAPLVRARIHDGIEDADYVAALKVLRRMIDNVQDELP